MYQHHIEIMQRSLQAAKAKVGLPALSQALFARFFELFPETREYFKDTDIASFGPQKFEIVQGFLLDTLKHPGYAATEVINEVMRHQAYGLKDKTYYFALIDSLQISVQQALGEDWNEDLAECWGDACEGMKAAVYEAARDYL